MSRLGVGIEAGNGQFSVAPTMLNTEFNQMKLMLKSERTQHTI